jgi:hypothetical protein
LIFKQLLNKSGLNSNQLLESFKAGTLVNLLGSVPVLSTIASDIVNSDHEGG